MKGLTNALSGTLLILMGLLLIIGGWALFEGGFWGFIPLILGALMATGFKELSPGNPKEAGLMTCFGERTNVKVEGLVLLLEVFGIEIVGVVTFNMQQEDMDFPIESIRASDKVRMKGSVSISFVPDDANLGNFDDAKQMKGIKSLIDDMLPVWLQTMAMGDPAQNLPGRDHEWLETNSLEIGKYLLQKLANISPADGDLNDLAGLGVKIKKISVKLTPISSDIIKAGEDRIVEQLQRAAELEDTETINRQVESRFALYGGTISKEKCREQVMFERLAKDKKVNIVQGGTNVNLSSVGNTNGRGGN